jgi:hypothetical protein
MRRLGFVHYLLLLSEKAAQVTYFVCALNTSNFHQI